MFFFFKEKKVSWHTAKYGNPYSEFVLCIYPSKCTHTAVNTHTVNTHPEQLGVRWLAQGHLVMVLKVERALYIHSPHLKSLPDRDSNSQPFDYESESLQLGHDFPHSLHSSWNLTAVCRHQSSFMFIKYKKIDRIFLKNGQRTLSI